MQYPSESGHLLENWFQHYVVVCTIATPIADSCARTGPALLPQAHNTSVNSLHAITRHHQEECENYVAPLKSLALPNLELMAAAITSRAATFIQDTLQLQDAPAYFWGDSQIVLHWLASTKPLPQFIQNRVVEINTAFPDAPWQFCPTVYKPADLLTRGVNFEQCNSSSNLWWKGPHG